MRIVVLKDREFLEDLKDGELKEIATTDKEINIYDELVIGGKHYIPSQISHSKEMIGVREFDPSNESERFYESDLTCPYCGYEDIDAFELSEDSGEDVCGRCGAELEYERHIEVTYTTKLLKKPKRVKI